MQKNKEIECHTKEKRMDNKGGEERQRKMREIRVMYKCKKEHDG